METIELRNFPMDLKFFVEEFEYVYRVQVWFPTLDRDNNSSMDLFIYFSYPKDTYSKAEAIRAALIEAISHEIDECFYVNNKRLFDPHLSAI